MADEANKQASVGGKGNKLVVILLGLVVVLVIALIITVAAVFVNQKKTAETTEPKRTVVVSAENAEEVAEELIQQTYVEPGYYNTQMTTTWHFASGDSVSEDAYVLNDAGNTNDVFFDVFLENDESDPLYQSPVLPRGSELEGIKLDKKLDAGTYNCICVYHLVDDKQNTVSTLRVAFTIIVES